MTPGLRPSRDADDPFARHPGTPGPTAATRRIVPTDTADLLAHQGLTDTAAQLALQNLTHSTDRLASQSPTNTAGSPARRDLTDTADQPTRLGPTDTAEQLARRSPPLTTFRPTPNGVPSTAVPIGPANDGHRPTLDGELGNQPPLAGPAGTSPHPAGGNRLNLQPPAPLRQTGAVVVRRPDHQPGPTDPAPGYRRTGDQFGSAGPALGYRSVTGRYQPNSGPGEEPGPTGRPPILPGQGHYRPRPAPGQVQGRGPGPVPRQGPLPGQGPGQGRGASGAGELWDGRRPGGPGKRPSELPEVSAGLSDPGVELADQLKRAWLTAGRPSMSEVGDEVGYSKASISKVLSGKMAPAWQLVRKLGVTLGVPRETVQHVWHPLWIAADTRRRQANAPEVRASDRPCARCGCVVAEPRDHEAWHAGLDVLLQAPTAATSHQWAILRNAVRRRED